MKQENSETTYLNFLVECSKTSLGDRLFIKMKLSKEEITTELFTCPGLFPNWESQSYSITIEEMSHLSFSAFIENSKGEISAEDHISRDFKQLKFKAGIGYLCFFKFNSSEISLSEIEQTTEDKEFEENCRRMSCNEDTNYILNYIKTTDIYLIGNNIKELINKIAAFNNSKDYIPEEYSEFNEDESLFYVTRIVLYRLTILFKKREKFDFIFLNELLQIVFRIIKTISESTNCDQMKFLMCLILHCSSAFVDPDLMSVEKAKHILISNQSVIEKEIYSLERLTGERDQLKIVEKTLGLIEEIINSKTFRLKLRRFILKYQTIGVRKSGQELEESLVFFKKNLKTIKFVDGKVFSGMCGIGGEIYVNLEILKVILDKHALSGINDKKIISSKVFLVSTILHEDAHSLLRELVMKNWLSVSPRAKTEKLKIEAGYDFEELLFGSCISDFNYASKLIDINFWNDDTNFLDTNEFNIQKLLEENLNKNLSGISCRFAKIIFK